MTELGTLENPIRVNHVRGERTYLDALACPHGHLVEYRRVGSVGVGSGDEMLDRYEVWCGKCRSEPRELFFDMYHPGAPDQHAVPDGFTSRVSALEIASDPAAYTEAVGVDDILDELSAMLDSEGAMMPPPSVMELREVIAQLREPDPLARVSAAKSFLLATERAAAHQVVPLALAALGLAVALSGRPRIGAVFVDSARALATDRKEVSVRGAASIGRVAALCENAKRDDAARDRNYVWSGFSGPGDITKLLVGGGFGLASDGGSVIVFLCSSLEQLAKAADRPDLPDRTRRVESGPCFFMLYDFGRESLYFELPTGRPNDSVAACMNAVVAACAYAAIEGVEKTADFSEIHRWIEFLRSVIKAQA